MKRKSKKMNNHHPHRAGIAAPSHAHLPDMLQNKQPSIDFILKIDKIVSMGLMSYSFVQSYFKSKTKPSHPPTKS